MAKILSQEERRSIKIKNLGTGMLGKKHSEETKEKIRKAMKGRKPSKSTRTAVSLSNKLRGCSKKTREKMSKSRMGRKAWNKGRKCTKEEKALISKMLKKRACRGKNHPNWCGGITSLQKQIKKSPEYKRWREFIFKRDNYICQKCNKTNGRIHPHHIKAFSIILRDNKIKTLKDALNCGELWNINNGLTLCKKCHKKTKNYGHFKKEPLIQETS